MKYHKMLLVGFFLLGVGTSNAQSAQAQQPPSLVAQSGRTVSASLGSSAQSFQIASTILKETRQILVVLPASYAQSAPERKYPLTVVVDGAYLMAPVAAMSNELTRNGQIPESVIVGIENAGGADFLVSNQKRVYDLTPPGLSVSGSNLNQGGDLFLDFIEKELLPAVDRQFRTAAPRIFVGVSSGGILATYVAATRSTYCAVVSLDAPINLGDNWLAKKLTERAAAGGRPVRYASLEAKFGWPESAWKTLVAAAPASWKLYREKFQLEGHETMQTLGAYLGLRQVFSDYSRFSYPQSPTTSILPYYTKVNATLDAPVLPPKRVLQDVVEDLLMEGRGVAAREAYNTLVSGYGAPAKKALSQDSDRSRKRDEWQRPAEVLDALGVKPGHRVADIGCGFGYFAFRLATRVGAEGKVYAVDIDREAIDKVRQRKEREKLGQVEPILGESDDPRLPNDLDAVLIVDTYHEFREYDRMMKAVFRALKPGGRLVIIDGEAPSGRPRTEYHRLHTIPAELVREEVARHGFVFKESRPGFYDPEYGKKMYFLIFESPLPDSSPRTKVETWNEAPEKMTLDGQEETHRAILTSKHCNSGLAARCIAVALSRKKSTACALRSKSCDELPPTQMRYATIVSHSQSKH